MAEQQHLDTRADRKTSASIFSDSEREKVRACLFQRESDRERESERERERVRVRESERGGPVSAWGRGERGVRRAAWEESSAESLGERAVTWAACET